MRVSLALVSLVLVGAAGARAEPPAAKRKPPPPAPAIPSAIAARLPPQGFLIAHTTDLGAADAFVITRIDRGGTHELVRDAVLPDAMTWLDAHTLVTITTDGQDVTTVRRYVDGAAGPATTVDGGAWTLPKGKTLVDTQAPELHVGKGGAVWLTRCHTLRARGPMDVCTGRAWLRVDGAKVTAAKKPPAGVKRATAAVPSLEDLARLPKGVKPPAGYAVKLTRVTVEDEDVSDTVKGFVCTGPGGATATWPAKEVSDWQYDVRPTKVTWLTATPPMFAVTGKATNPIGEVTTEHRVFRACQPGALDDVVWLGDSRRLEMKMNWQGDRYAGTTWTLYVDDVAVGAIEGAPGGVQVAPQP